VIRLLPDENISPSLVNKLGDEGVYAEAVLHVGLSGRSDPDIWKHALDNDFAVVTTNARDFIRLLSMEVHPGLIVLHESGLTCAEQWQRILPVLEEIRASGDSNFMVNKLVEISGPGKWESRQIPKP